MKLIHKLNKDEGLFLLACGHEKRIDLIKYKKGLYRCQECFIQSLHKDAERVGLKCISDDINGTRNTYEFLKCKHTVSLTPPNIRNSQDNLMCKVCFENNLRLNANRNNVEILDGKTKPSIRLCKFNCCGLVKPVSIESINNNVRCPSCYPKLTNIRISNETSLEVLPEKQKKDYKLFKLPCGHTKVISISCAKSNSWVCRECKETYYDQPNHLYLLKITSASYSWLKLGFTKNIEKRFKEYNVTGDASYDILYCEKFDTGYDVMIIEKKIHKLFSSLKLNKILMRNYMQRNGYTECYPLEACDVIMEELKKVKEIKYD